MWNPLETLQNIDQKTIGVGLCSVSWMKQPFPANLNMRGDQGMTIFGSLLLLGPLNSMFVLTLSENQTKIHLQENVKP